MLFFLIFLIILDITFSYNIRFLSGSFIKKDLYIPLLNKIQTNLNNKNITSSYEFINYFDTLENDQNIILICHSFGCYFGLLKCLADKRNNIKACILINGNFNQRRKMFYPGIKLNDIDQPVLTILNIDDKRLPIDKAIDDLYVKYEEIMKANSTIPPKNLGNKLFILNNGTHFSSFKNGKELVTTQIIDFLESCKIKLTNNKIIFHHSLLNFIKSKPITQSHIYHGNNSVYFKTNNYNIDRHLANYYFHPIKWNKIYYNISKENYTSTKILNFLNYRKQIVDILDIWFTKQPQVKYEDKKLICDLIIIPIKDNITYYKFPTREYILDTL